jgi:hypothetical protein
MASTTNTTTAAAASDSLDIPDFLKRDKTAATKPTPATRGAHAKAVLATTPAPPKKRETKAAAPKKPTPKAQPKTDAKTKAKPEAKKPVKVKPKKAEKPDTKKAAVPNKGSLVDQLIELLKSPKGATNEEAAKKLGFKTAQSVRGTINGPVKKRHKVASERDAERGTVYRIK